MQPRNYGSLGNRFFLFLYQDPSCTMRNLTLSIAIFVLAASCTAQVTRSDSPAVTPPQVVAPKQQIASLDSVVQFLLTSAAADFHAHRPPDPVRFRNVRVGHMADPSGEKRYILCGEFLPSQVGGKAKWTPFATIKTSGYEQYLGAQAAAWSKDPSFVWDKVGDLSSTLQSRLDALR